jgi:murein tripeptide amidase MpaA
VTYILNKLLTSQDPVIQDLAQSFDYYFFPSVNPDGYVYTHTTVSQISELLRDFSSFFLLETETLISNMSVISMG